MALTFLPSNIARPRSVSPGALLVPCEGTPIGVPIASIATGRGGTAYYVLLGRALRNMIDVQDEMGMSDEDRAEASPDDLPPVLRGDLWSRRSDGAWISTHDGESAEALWRWHRKGKLWVLKPWAKFWMHYHPVKKIGVDAGLLGQLQELVEK